MENVDIFPHQLRGFKAGKGLREFWFTVGQQL
ncbi:Uncharacterised protein [Vibrio cholerae]|nr:Uncharacterised protein [Vibrio cholerae]CRZ97299.1 Uncharacterised protein [Vibrio cholerae]CSA81300.1 Uncharacterised protein [Vibrio cholerae]CSC06382.1 Uncharacterised protein [Vibrio cholerae]CSC59278.1 Uncharacterised protein [Vibrio cholerae]